VLFDEHHRDFIADTDEPCRAEGSHGLMSTGVRCGVVSLLVSATGLFGCSEAYDPNERGDSKLDRDIVKSITQPIYGGDTAIDNASTTGAVGASASILITAISDNSLLQPCKLIGYGGNVSYNSGVGAGPRRAGTLVPEWYLDLCGDYCEGTCNNGNVTFWREDLNSNQAHGADGDSGGGLFCTI
jgi:hypothetical protein